MKRRITLLLLIIFSSIILSCEYGLEETMKSLKDNSGGSVSIKNIAGVTPPAYGEIPVNSITETEQFSGTVVWSPAHSPFGGNTVYTAIITLAPKNDYTFEGVEENFFSVAGATTVTNDVDSGVVTAVFPATGATPPSVVSESLISGVTPPESGETPVSTITTNSQFMGSVSWTPNDNPFGYGIVYTATITLTAINNHTFNGVAADFFTVTGATTVTNDVNSGVVTAVFPATDPLEVINISAISGVTPPVAGALPVSTVIETLQFTGTVSWTPNDSPFGYGIVYTATINLTAKPGYTLTGVTQNFFTVSGATSDTNLANSGIVTALFSETERASVTYNANGGTSGTVPVDGSSYSSGDSVTVLGNTGNLKGELIHGSTYKAFLGWSTNASATAAQYKPNDTFNITQDTTLYAIYTALRLPGPAGGTIFYDAGSTQSWGRYLEAWTAEAMFAKQWKTANTSTGGTSTGIGTGYYNTYTALSSAEYEAAAYVRAQEYGGYTDWFLPSRDELSKMYINLISGTDENGDTYTRITTFDVYRYWWSSSEYNDQRAWFYSFESGNPTSTSKDTWYRTIAVRAF